METVKVAFHRASGQYIRSCGYSLTAEGRIRPHAFYLGRDLPTALVMALRLKADWAAVRASGSCVWGSDYLAAWKANAVLPTIRAATNAITPMAATPMVGKAAKAAPQTVRQAAEAFIAEIEQRQKASQCSAAYLRGMRHRIWTALEQSPKADILGKPIASVSAEDLAAIVLHWASRPIRRSGYGYKRPKHSPISVCYAKHLIKSIQRFFEWADETERWLKPRAFDRIFRLKFREQLQEPPHFSIAELGLLYRTASKVQRLWILLGLNCGFDCMGLASLHCEHIKGNHIERRRHKTGVYSKHLIWAETAALLKSVGQPQGLVCLAEDGQPLVIESKGRKDSVGAAWRNLLLRVNKHKPRVRPLPFGTLRKTGAWLVKQIGGLEVSEMYLAHSEPGMNRHYAGRNWQALDQALRKLAVQLKPLFSKGICGAPEAHRAVA